MQSDSSSVSNPPACESLCDRSGSCHSLKAHMFYACICCGCSHPQCGRGKEKESTPKRKLRPVSLMAGEIIGDRYQTCPKGWNKSSLIRFLTLKSLNNSVIFSIFASIIVLFLESVVYWLLIYKENLTNYYFPFYLLGWGKISK